MTTKYGLSIYIFRRDLRIQDNTALIKALSQSKEVIPVFIFDPVLMGKPDKNSNAIQFMNESLQELKDDIENQGGHLYLFYGKPKKVINELITDLSIDAVFSNKDYSPYSKNRSNDMDDLAKNNRVDYLEYSDYVLVNPEVVYTGSGDRYQVFTYFYKKSQEFEVKSIVENNFKNYYRKSIAFSDPSLLENLSPTPNPSIFEHGGRIRAIQILDNLDQFDDYEDTRDYPWMDGTTRLSPHNKFGTVSIREVYYRLKELFGKDHPLIRQLYWRDFYIYLSIHYPHVFDKAFKKKYEAITWENDKDKFKRWCSGQTGFPIVDAGMRQLNTTGYMHNRIRMVVASFLVKDLHIDWKWGEQYFAKQLIDYDVMVNNGNWQWAASTGADAQPYFRIFNPWSQQRKYDPDTKYIKKYIDELSDLPSKAIHKLHQQRPSDGIEYPKPIVDHKKQAEKAKSLFKEQS